MAEVARLGSENADVTAFGGGGTWGVGPPMTAARVDAVLGRRGSLVISEVYEYGPPTASFSAHPYGTYLELANNADTVIYLDRKVVGRVLPQPFFDYPTFDCAFNARYRLDPGGLWSRDLWELPGSGRDYPLAPGKAVILATDAIDHRVFHPTLLDLSSADFEFLGTAQDVDNPFVPNILSIIGLAGSFEGHGAEFRGVGPQVIFVANPLDVPGTALLRDRFPNQDLPFWRYPSEKVLDVYAEQILPSLFQQQYAECVPMVHPLYDRQRAALGDYTSAGSVRRRVFAVQPDGRVVLQRTRTSARDFERVPTPTPKQVP